MKLLILAILATTLTAATWDGTTKGITVSTVSFVSRTGVPTMEMRVKPSNFMVTSVKVEVRYIAPDNSTRSATQVVDIALPGSSVPIHFFNITESQVVGGPIITERVDMQLVEMGR